MDGDVPLLGERKPLPHTSLSRQFFAVRSGRAERLREFAFALDAGKRIDHVPGILPHPFCDSGMCGDVAPVVVDGSIRNRVLDGDLSLSG